MKSMFIELCHDLAKLVVEDISTYVDVPKDEQIKFVANHHPMIDTHQSESIN